MKRKTLWTVLIVVLVAVVSVLGAPPVTEAVVITSVTVTTTDGSIFAGCVGVCANQVWSFPVGGINLLPGETLVLTQDPGSLTGAAAYNFDTSDHGTGNPTIAVNADPTIIDTTGILNFGGLDTNSTATNEAKNYSGSIGGVAGSYEVQVGYADTLHTDACADSADFNCFPTGGVNGGPFAGATFFFGGGAGDPGNGFPTGPNCTFASTNCFDAGVILITALSVSVPEPATLLLLGTGLLGLAAYGSRKFRKDS